MTSTVPMASSRLVMRALRSGAPRAARPGVAGTNTTRAASCSTSAKASRSDSRPDGVLHRPSAALQASSFLVQERLKLKPNRTWDPLRPVRVRRDPPTLEEAVVAAQGLSDGHRAAGGDRVRAHGHTSGGGPACHRERAPFGDAPRFRAQLAPDAAGGCPQAASGALRLPAIAAP